MREDDRVNIIEASPPTERFVHHGILTGLRHVTSKTARNNYCQLELMFMQMAKAAQR